MNDAQYNNAIGVTSIFRKRADEIRAQSQAALDENEANWRRALRDLKPKMLPTAAVRSIPNHLTVPLHT